MDQRPLKAEAEGRNKGGFTQIEAQLSKPWASCQNYCAFLGTYENMTSAECCSVD